MNYSIAMLQTDDRASWESLYRVYADFYQVPMTPEILDTLWSWAFDEANPFYALLAKDDHGKAIGLMHCRAMPSPLRGKMVGFLDDFFIIPECRGSGAAQQMYEALKELGRSKGRPFVRWITAENNYRGRGSYDKVADKTHWLTYQMPTD